MEQTSSGLRDLPTYPQPGTLESACSQYLPLYRAVDNGDLEATTAFIKADINLLGARISPAGDTPLHLAAIAGHVRIVKELVRLMTATQLELRNIHNITAFFNAIVGANTNMVEIMLDKNPELLSLPNHFGCYIPVVDAARYGHKDLVQYLYRLTPEEKLSPDPVNGSNGVVLLDCCITAEIYDIALHLLEKYPRLAIEKGLEGYSVLHTLAGKPSAFPSGCRLAFWRRWIYSCAVPGISKHMHDQKLRHMQANGLLNIICQETAALDESRFSDIGVYRAIFKAVRYGTVELLSEIIKCNPNNIWCVDEDGLGIFLYATLLRQEKIFSLLYQMDGKKNFLMLHPDKFGNNILHGAAILAPSSQLGRVSGAALQMQRELQWFKEVENIVQPHQKVELNKEKKTPRELFTEQHKKLVEGGERWMKDTATACSVVAALIVTIMFAAAFTVPGGYNGDNGVPVCLHTNFFMVFIISDALSLFSSTTSVLMFLGILTSRYREEDFLKSLPAKLIIGLSGLFFSLATMMIAFVATLKIVLEERLAWIYIPIGLIAVIPVTLFVCLQFPLLLEIFMSTYGPGVF